MPAGTVMGHVHLHVGDLDAAAAFYHAALGLDKVVWSYPGALFLSAGGYHHHLGTNTWAAGAARAGDGRSAAARVGDRPAGRGGRGRGGRQPGARRLAEDRPGRRRLVRNPWSTAVRLRADDALRHF